MSSPLTHFDAQGQAHMVDVSGKDSTHRVARATGLIRMRPATMALITSGTAKKGDVLGVARIAAIQGAKRTADLVPLCHPLPITRVAVDFELDEAAATVRCTAQVETLGRTGVEMEALTAVQVGLLTVYDMCKAVDRGMVMDGIRVLRQAWRQVGRLGRRAVSLSDRQELAPAGRAVPALRTGKATVHAAAGCWQGSKNSAAAGLRNSRRRCGQVPRLVVLARARPGRGPRRSSAACPSGSAAAGSKACAGQPPARRRW